MKRIWARISIMAEVSDSEWEAFREKYGREQEISREDAEEIVKRGHVSADSYIPQDVFDYPQSMGL